MQAEVIAIGDELTSGQRLDTNSQWISERLGELGVRTLYHTTVGDDLAANAEVFRRAIERADIVISTGGLGPTADDLTRQALAEATGRELVLDETSLAHIEAMFARRGRTMPPQNRFQAFFPLGSRAIPNPFGTAPGIDFEAPREGGSPCRVFCLPGVPAELFHMWPETIAPEIERLQPSRRVICHRRIKCFGAGESEIERMLPDLIRRARLPIVGITVSDATITLRITSEGESVEGCRQSMQPTVETIYQGLGPLVFGEEDDELEDAVVRLLVERRKTLATVEWGTAGLVASWLGAVEGAGEHYLGGLVVSNHRTLAAAAGADLDRLTLLPPTSRECAEEMSRLWREQTGANIGMAVGAFPQRLAENQEPNRLYFALADETGVKSSSIPFAGQPEFLRKRSAKQGLDLVRRALLLAG